MTSQIRVDEITNRTGLGTVTIYDNGFEFTGVTTFTENVDIEGNLTIGGVLTYEDTTNIDSVGVITARAGVHVTGGNLAVGHNNPSVNLHVKGSASNGQIYLGGTGAHSQIYADNDGVLILNADQGNSAANSYLGFNVDNSERLRVDSSGRLLIGRTSALASSAERLTIDDGMAIFRRNSDNAAALYIRNEDTTADTRQPYIIFTDGGGNRGGFGVQYNESSLWISGQNGITFRTGGTAPSTTERVRINSAGLVGIGTDAPSGKMNIVGSDTQLLNLIQNSGDLAIRLNDRGSGSAYIKVRDNTGGSLSFDTGGSERLRITSEGEMYLTGGTTNGSLHFWEGAGVSGNSDTARLGVGKDNNTLIYSNAASPSRSNFAIGTSGSIPLILSTSNTTRLRITSGGITEFLGSAIKMPVGTSDPGSAATGWAYYNSSNTQLRIYDGSTWGGVAFSTKGTQTNPATSSSDLSASGSLAQYYFAPDGGTAFQNYACGGLSNLGTIPSGGPSWVTAHNSLLMIVKGQVGQTSQYVMSQGNYLKFISESISRTTNTPYIYWAVFDSGTLWGITRTRWTGATYSTWGSNHDWDTGEANPPSGTVNWDVWKTGSGTTGNTLATGTYTVSNDSNLVRAVLPQQSHNAGSTAYGIHYKRTNSGEHYPWFNSSGNITSNGYFEPSGTYNLGSDTRYVHYIYLADT